MNNKVNYTLIGILVLIGITFMLGFTYWLLKPSAERELTKYAILFDESVLGLNMDASVKYRGIDVGKVTKIQINPKNTEQVEVIVTILKTTPVKTTTIAKLTSQGITGLSYINLSLGDNNSEPLTVKEGDKYPIIKTVPSFFERFEESLGTVSTNLTKTLNRTSKLLDDENQEQITLLLKRTAKFMDKMERLLDEKTIVHFKNSMENLDSSSSKLDTMMPKIETFIQGSTEWEQKISKSMESIMTSYLGVRSSMAEIKRAVKSGEFNLKEISKDVVPTANTTFLQMQELMVKVENALEQYERSPGDIIFKQEESKKGPGE